MNPNLGKPSKLFKELCHTPIPLFKSIDLDSSHLRRNYLSINYLSYTKIDGIDTNCHTHS